MQLTGVFCLDFFVKLLESIELRRESALGSCVYDENDLSLELFKRVGRALLVDGLKVVESGC